MCSSCFSDGLNRREFIGRAIKTSGTLGLAMAGGLPMMGSGIFADPGNITLFPDSLQRLNKKPANVRVVFLYPPADVVNEGRNEDRWARHNWFTWPGNQFEPEQQEALFTSKISSIAKKLGVHVSFAPEAIYQKARVDEFIDKTSKGDFDAVLVVNFWNTFSAWSFEIATQSAPVAIVYQPVGSNHQRPPANLLNTIGLHYIHSIENWDEIERGLMAIRAKKMLAQSRLLRVSDVGNEMSISREELLHTEIVNVSAEEFNGMFDAVKADSNVMSEAMELKKKASKVMDVTDHYFAEGIRSHHAVRQIMEKYGADAITINCLMLEHRKPCLSFAMNNGDLIPCGCENDLNASLTMMLGRWLFERGGFQQG